MSRRETILCLFGLSILISLSWLVYAPGLHGSFLFDDFGNLPALGAYGPIDHWPVFWRYITSGSADPTGRPLTLLTFLLDARDWPAAPLPFKRTNLILHILNGLLLAGLLMQLGRKACGTANPIRVKLAAVIAAGFWLLHPLLVSTTLYIVQREAMLPATFTLLGLLAWLHGRQIILEGQGHIWRGVLWIATGLGGCTVLGVLSKANGILLPGLALVIEYSLLRPTRPKYTGLDHSVYQRAMLVFGWLPAGIVAAYLLEQGWSGLTQGISSVRPWTLAQRLLTEPRVLLDYLDLLWLPRPFTPGLFNDQIQASTSVWSPVTTLPAILTVLSLIVGACLLRKHRPAVALAILFYFAGQALESSTVALELYFEHRNYLPAMLMFWPLALWLCDLKVTGHEMLMGKNTHESNHAPASPPNRSPVNRAKFALAATIMLGLAAMTHARASLWGNEHDQALLWARLNPESPRAQAGAAMVEMNSGEPGLAAHRLRGLLSRSPDQVQLALNLFGAQCQLGQIPSPTLAAARKALRLTRDPGTLLTSWFERTMTQLDRPPCPQLTSVTLSSLLQAALSNPYLSSNAGRQQDLHYLEGHLALLDGNPNAALMQFNQALDLQVRPAIALRQAALLGASGFPRQGLAHLNHFEAASNAVIAPGFGMPSIHAWVLSKQDYWPKELARLHATLRDDAQRQPSSSP